MPAPRLLAATNVVEGKIYVIGGYTTENSVSTNNLTQVYDPQTDLWTIKASAPLPIAGSASAVIDNKIYILGGKSASQGVMEVYDPANDSWAIKTATDPGYWPTAAASTDTNHPRIFFFAENRTDVYDAATDSWSSGAPAPVARLIARVASVDGTFFLIGGRTGQWGYITMEYPTTLNEQYYPNIYSTMLESTTSSNSLPAPTPTVPEMHYCSIAVALVLGKVTFAVLFTKKVTSLSRQEC
jgi:hypothetical protein